MADYLQSIGFEIAEMQPQSDRDGFKHKREAYSFNIRKSEREEILAKRRGFHLKNLTMETESLQRQGRSYTGNKIIDQRYSEQIKSFYKQVYSLSQLPDLIYKLQCQHDIVTVHHGAIGIRKILSCDINPPVQAIIDSGVLPKLIFFVNQDEYPQLQLEAIWALANIASGTHEQCQSMVNKGVIPIFVRMLKSDHMGIKEQLMWALGNISCDSLQNRDQIIEMGGVQSMIAVISGMKHDDFSEQWAWALSNLCRGSTIPDYNKIKDAINLFIVLISQDRIRSEQVLADCLWSISYSTKALPERLEPLFQYGLYTRIVALLQMENISIVIPTLQLFGKITMGSQKQIEMVLSQDGVMGAIKNLLLHPKSIVRIQTCWVLSHIAASQQKYVQQILTNKELTSLLLNLLETDCQKVAVEIIRIIGNLPLEGDPHLVFKFFKEKQIVRHLFKKLETEDGTIIKTVFENFYLILDLGETMKSGPQNPFIQDIVLCGGHKVLEGLQVHQDNSVYNETVKFMDTFFEQENMKPY